MAGRIVAEPSLVEHLAEDLSRTSRLLEDAAGGLRSRGRHLAAQGLGSVPEGRELEVQLARVLRMLGLGSDDFAAESRALRRYAEELRRGERRQVVLPIACMPALPAPVPFGKAPGGRGMDLHPMGAGCSALVERQKVKVVRGPVAVLVPDPVRFLVETPGGRTRQRRRHPAIDAVRGRLRGLSDEVKRQVEEAISRALRSETRFPRQDGKEFENPIRGRKRLLPTRRSGHYTEWTAAGSGHGRGEQRVIIGGDPRNPEAIYFWSHAKETTAIKIWP